MRHLLLPCAVMVVTLASCSSGTSSGTRPLAWTDSLTWAQGEGPDAREHGVMVLDERGDRILLFGGSGYEPQLRPLDDLWSLNLETRAWTRLTPQGDVPAGGGSRRAAVVSGQSVAYLFGGYDENQQPNNDLYRMDFSDEQVTFARVEQTNPPSARLLHAFVYDPAHRRFILNGGVGAAGFNDDTWMMTLEDGRANWTQLDLATMPSARYGAAFAYDDASQQMIIFSGADQRFPNESPNDTWALDLSGDSPTWSLLNQPVPADSIPGRRNPLWVWDATASRLFVWGGTADGRTAVPGLLIFDPAHPDSGWKALDLPGSPALRASGFGVHDPSRKLSWMGFGNFRDAYRDLHALSD